MDIPAIEINNLFKKYKNGTEFVVKDLSLTINKNDIFGLLGPNGAGKTTTISTLCGLLKKTTGEIKINGLTLDNNLEKIKKSIGVVAQNIALYQNLTTYENLYYFGRLYGINHKTTKQKIDIALDRLNLTKQKNILIKKLSGGMNRRINLLAGILHEPSILFLDEPTVGIDVQSRNIILEYLKELNAKGTTILYTSHYMEEAEKLCNNIAIIDYGKIIAQGNPNELIGSNGNCKNLEELFLELTGREIRDN